MPELKSPHEYEMFVNGEWVGARSGERYERYSPSHDILVGTYPLPGPEDADDAVAAARRAFDKGPWPRMSGAERARILNRVAALIRERAEELAEIEVWESGKPIAQARGEMNGAADVWEYAATLAQHAHGETYNQLGEHHMGLLLREPIGVVVIILPWNFPFWLLAERLPFALAPGCTTIVKPSELTPGTALRLGEILLEAGMPPGVVNIVPGHGVPVGAHLAEHHDVDMVSFTGSTAVGRKILEASKSNIKKVSLELGGKNPQIVFADAKWEEALDAVVYGSYFNMGECCVAGSRLLVQREIADDFSAAVTEQARRVKVGDPFQEETQVGPIINEQQYDKIMNLIASGREEGAALRLGGNPLSTQRGRFIEASVFSDVSPTMAIAREEIFGPVLSIIPFDATEDAIRIANDTMYGLASSVWTDDLDTAFTMARNIRAGRVWLNTYLDDFPELPYGGYKQSGLGRQTGAHAIEEYTELKTVLLHLGDRQNWWTR